MSTIGTPMNRIGNQGLACPVSGCHHPHNSTKGVLMGRVTSFMLLALLAAGCDEIESLGSTEPAPRYPPLPPEIVAVADPRQDLTVATLLEEDRCYWVEHRNVVETTFLPLLTPDGRHICLAPEADAAAEAS